MANGAIETKIHQDIEYKVIGNAFGVLVAGGGLLAGAMVSQRSIEYWQEDIAMILLLAIMSVNLLRSFVVAMTTYQSAPVLHRTTPAQRENVQSEQAYVAQISAPPKYTAEQVLDQVAKRIEAQKEEALKKNKMIN